MARATTPTEQVPEYLHDARRAVSRTEESLNRADEATASLENRLEVLKLQAETGFRYPRRAVTERAATSELLAIPAKLRETFVLKAQVEARLEDRRRELQDAEDRWASEQTRQRRAGSQGASDGATVESRMKR